MSSLVEVMWGSQTFPHGSSKINVNALVMGDRTAEVFPTDVLEKKSSCKTLASRDDNDKFGVWYRATFAPHDGVLLKIQSTVTVERSPYLQVGLLVLLRESGPFFCAKMKVNRAANARFQAIPVFMGRGDILTPDEVAVLGYDLKAFFVHNFFEEEELEEGLVIEELGPAITMRPEIRQVRQTDGTVVSVSVPRAPPRRVRIRKKD